MESWADQEEEETIGDILNRTDPKNVPVFSFCGYECPAVVSSIEEGDTCTILFPFGGRITKITIRLKGIEAPKSRRDEEKAKKSKAYLESLVIGPKAGVIVSFDRFDKNGRPLATLYINNQKSMSVNEMMFRGGYATIFRNASSDRRSSHALNRGSHRSHS